MSETKPRVLCVDDEASVLRSLSWLLQRDFEVTTTTKPVDAIALVATKRFDVIVSDQRMPGKTGVEVLREARAHAPRTMRILLTGYSDLDAILDSVNEGEIFRFVNKPWNNDELRRIVQLAARAAKTDVEARARQAAEMGSRYKVLVVDDNPALPSMVDELARGTKIDVVTATDVRDALSAFVQQDIAVLITETVVGGTDVTQLIEVLKHEHPDVVTVVITDQRDAAMVIRLINHGQIYRFVPKPVRSGLLKLAIHAAVSKHCQLRGNPTLRVRHTVEPLDDQITLWPLNGAKPFAMPTVPKPAATNAPARSSGSLLGRLRQLFGV